MSEKNTKSGIDWDFIVRENHKLLYQSWKKIESEKQDKSLDQKEINRLLNIAFATKEINYYLNQKQTMEKQIKMSLETAQKLWKQNNSIGGMEFLNTILLENFTKEELEGKKGFTWADCFDGGGWYISPNSDVMFSGISSNPTLQNKNVFKTREQAESALAFSQLTHIVAKYNEGKARDEVFYKIRKKDNESLCITDNRIPAHLEFYSITDARISLDVNYELWAKYWMLPNEWKGMQNNEH